MSLTILIEAADFRVWSRSIVRWFHLVGESVCVGGFRYGSVSAHVCLRVSTKASERATRVSHDLVSMDHDLVSMVPSNLGE